MPAALVLVGIGIGLGVLGWVSGGFWRVLPDFWRLVEGPLPDAASLLRWQLPDWGSLSAIASVHWVALACEERTQKKHRGFALATTMALNLAIPPLMILLGFGLRGSHAWVVLGILLAGIPSGLWILIITGIWWLAPTFMAQREGALPILPPFPMRSLGGPALLAARVVFQGFLIATFGLLVALVYDFGVSLFLFLPLLNKDVSRPRDQS